MGANNFLQSKIRQDVLGNPYVTAGGVGEQVDENANLDLFFYDTDNSPLKSTQQLNLDWSKFENHTFFMSAEVKVNVAFENIINNYPFDGTQKEIEEFLDKLTGFEKWVFDSFPRYHGALHFVSSSQNYISVTDTAGSLYPDLAKNKSGLSIINPPDDITSLSLEFQINLPEQANQKSVIFQKISNSTNTMGFSVHLDNSDSSVSASCYFVIASGTNVLVTSASLTKGTTNHVCTILDKSDELSVAKIYVNQNLISSSDPNTIHKLDIDSSNFTIGSGSKIYDNLNIHGKFFTPVTTLSGTLDEVRIFHGIRDQKLQKLYANKTIFSTPDLKLYYKFNEPADLATPSSNSTNSVVLDSSGNSLHAQITNFSSSLRVKSSDINSMTAEKDLFAPVLFPGYEPVADLNSNLLYSASLYDQINPNIITRFVPPHYLLEGTFNDGFGMNVDGNGNEAYAGNGIPGTGKLGSQQMLLSFLYIWAKFFDEIKLFTDQFANLNYVDYETNETVPDNFLDDLVKRSGLNLPNLFTDSTVEQYLSGDNIEREIGISSNPLKYIQSMLTRRALVSMPNILKSKGTQYSIKAFLRSLGIDPDNSVRIREHGGSLYGSLGLFRENRSTVGSMLSFNDTSLLISPYLSGSRTEPGFPQISGQLVNGQSNNENDGLYTSGSWSYEGLYKFNEINEDSKTQSLVRLLTTGSALPNAKYLWGNLIAEPQRNIYDNSYLTLYICPRAGSTSDFLELKLITTGSGIFDGDKWYVSFGRQVKEEINSEFSSSYFLKVGKAVLNDKSIYYSTSGYFKDYNTTVLTNINQYNSSGSYISIGNNQDFSTSVHFLNNSSSKPDNSRLTNFEGLVSNIRFWSKALSETETIEHINNFESAGADLPAVGYNFVNAISGSFGKLRLNTVRKQDEVLASGTLGYLTLLDFSQNNMNLTGTGFLTGSSNFNSEIFNYSQISPYYDESVSNDKIRIRGFEDINNIENYQGYASPGPAYQIYKRFDVKDDNRFSIDFSLVDALNRDMINIFSNLDELNNGLGSPNMLFSPDYPDLEKLRDVYFNRLSSHIDFDKFFEFYRWFDTSISTFIDQLIPKRTLFKGANFIVEPHMLERSKLQYHYFENYTLGRAQAPAGSLPQSISWLTDTPTKKY